MDLLEFQNAIAKMQKQDLSALGKIYQEYFKKIYVLALYKVKHEQDAYDIAMTVMIKLSEYKGNAKEIKNHIGLMITMTQNAINDYFRRKGYIAAYGNEEILSSSGFNDALWFTDIMNGLTEEEQSIFIDHVIWDMKLKTIAKARGKSYIAIRRAYSIVKNKIKELYKE